MLTEAGSKKRASLHVIAGEQALADHDPGGLEVLGTSQEAFVSRLLSERRTLKRALTDPRVFSGIGNAYSDEILHAAQLSPLQMTTNLSTIEQARLYDAVQTVLTWWIDRLRDECGDAFP